MISECYHLKEHAHTYHKYIPSSFLPSSYSVGIFFLAHLVKSADFSKLICMCQAALKIQIRGEAKSSICTEHARRFR